MKRFVIMRGPAGCGKSTLAATFGGKVFSADDYFMPGNPGNEPGHGYEGSWSPVKLGKAHDWNTHRAMNALFDGVPCVVLDNTSMNVMPNLARLAAAATASEYTIEIVEPATEEWQAIKELLPSKDVVDSLLDIVRLCGRLTGRTVHGVPLSNLLGQVLSYREYTVADLLAANLSSR